MPTKDDLRYFQAMPLDLKISMSNRRLWEWVSYYGSDSVYVSFSGGKDSTVLADLYARLCQQCGWKMFLAFVNTGLEYPEIQKFVKWYAEWLRQTYSIEVELVILRPKMPFNEVIKKYGYPIIGKSQAQTIRKARKNLENGVYSLRLAHLGISVEEAQRTGLKLPDMEMLSRYEKSTKNSKFNIPHYRSLLTADFICSEQCCDVMKKAPAHQYQKETGKVPILATMAAESMNRESAWLKNGCNAFDSKDAKSTPMAFWTEQDVLQYIKQYSIPIASVYGDIAYANDPEQIRFDGCGDEKLITTGCDRTGCIFCGFGCHLERGPSRFQRLKETHPKQYDYCLNGGEYDENGVWKPNNQGLGMKHVFDELNKIYGEGFIKY